MVQEQGGEPVHQGRLLPCRTRPEWPGHRRFTGNDQPVHRAADRSDRPKLLDQHGRRSTWEVTSAAALAHVWRWYSCRAISRRDMTTVPEFLENRYDSDHQAHRFASCSCSATCSPTCRPFCIRAHWSSTRSSIVDKLHGRYRRCRALSSLCCCHRYRRRHATPSSAA